MNMRDHYPAIIREIGDVIGDDKALQLMCGAHRRADENNSKVKEKRPWRCIIYIASKETPATRWITQQLGDEAAAVLRERFGGAILEIGGWGGGLRLVICNALARDLYYKLGWPEHLIANVLKTSDSSVKQALNKPYNPQEVANLLARPASR